MFGNGQSLYFEKQQTYKASYGSENGTFKPKLKKAKNPPPKKFLCFRKWNFVTPQKLF